LFSFFADKTTNILFEMSSQKHSTSSSSAALEKHELLDGQKIAAGEEHTNGEKEKERRELEKVGPKELKRVEWKWIGFSTSF
jgi:hypothetical protein